MTGRTLSVAGQIAVSFKSASSRSPPFSHPRAVRYTSFDMTCHTSGGL